MELLKRSAVLAVVISSGLALGGCQMWGGGDRDRGAGGTSGSSARPSSQSGTSTSPGGGTGSATGPSGETGKTEGDKSRTPGAEGSGGVGGSYGGSK
jgi:hypothetical protein